MRLLTSTTFWVLVIIMGILFWKMPVAATWENWKEWGDMAVNGFYGYVLKEIGRYGSIAYKEKKSDA